MAHVIGRNEVVEVARKAGIREVDPATNQILVVIKCRRPVGGAPRRPPGIARAWKSRPAGAVFSFALHVLLTVTTGSFAGSPCESAFVVFASAIREGGEREEQMAIRPAVFGVRRRHQPRRSTLGADHDDEQGSGWDGGLFHLEDDRRCGKVAGTKIVAESETDISTETVVTGTALK